MTDTLKVCSELLVPISLLTTAGNYLSNARPAFLEGMELDRYFPKDDVALGFNGNQHYVATEL